MSREHGKRVIMCVLVLLVAPSARSEVLPSADAPVFMTLVKDGRPSAVIVVADDAGDLERLAAGKLVDWGRTCAGVDWKVLSRAQAEQEAAPIQVLLGSGGNQPIIKELIRDQTGGAADLPFLSEEGFGIQTLERAGVRYLLIAGRSPTGVWHGAVYARDFLLDILPDDNVVVREVKLVRSPAIPIRGPYLLPQYGVTPQYTLDHWKHIVERMAEGGINQIHWWIAGMYPSRRFPETFEITSTRLSIEDLRELCRYAQARGITFLVGGGGFFWHGVQKLAETHPETRASGTSGLCPSHPESQRLMVEYALEWLETVPEADGVWIEPRDEGGLCTCATCGEKLDDFSSRRYGQSEILFLKTLMKRVWERNSRAKLVWLVEYHSGLPQLPHYDDPLYFERIREMKDPRIEWQIVWEQFKLPGPGNRNLPVPFFTRNAQHWDKPYWPTLQNVFAHARLCAEQGYLGYANAWEIGFASNDWYINDVPYPVDLIPETLTSLGFREACWEPAQTWEEFIDRVHRRFFSREVPRQLAEDMLYLRQHITSSNQTVEFNSPMSLTAADALEAEVQRVTDIADPGQRGAALKRLSALVDVLKLTRAEALPRMDEIESRLAEHEPKASRKSRLAFELIRRAIADSRRVYQKAVPDDAPLDRAIDAVRTMQEALSKQGSEGSATGAAP